MRTDQPTPKNQAKCPWAEPTPAPAASNANDQFARLQARISDLIDQRTMMCDETRELREANESLRLRLAAVMSENRRLAGDAVNLSDMVSLLSRRYAEELAYRRAAEAAIDDAKQGRDSGGIDVTTADLLHDDR